MALRSIRGMTGLPLSKYEATYFTDAVNEQV
jgi:hypothetical protein